MEHKLSLKTKNEHTRDKHITFIDEGHKYFIKKEEYNLSVTGFVHSFFPKFKADEIIGKMMMSRNWQSSKYFGMEVEEIKQAWEDNANQAAELGTALHKSIEEFYNNTPTPMDTVEYKYFEEFEIDHNTLKPFRTEWEIYDEELKLAGSIDMVFEDKEGNYHLYDWKRSKQIKENNQYEEGYFPLSHLPNANYWQYSLQLNIYKQIGIDGHIPIGKLGRGKYRRTNKDKFSATIEKCHKVSYRLRERKNQHAQVRHHNPAYIFKPKILMNYTTRKQSLTMDTYQKVLMTIIQCIAHCLRCYG